MNETCAELAELPGWIIPVWPAPISVRALCTTRCIELGRSKAPYDQFNMAEHVGDSSEVVINNRSQLPCPNITWLEQIHSVRSIELPVTNQDLKADASFTLQPETTCVVMTADCLPILVCDKKGRWVGAIHAGWRGLANGIIEKTLISIKNKYSESFQTEDVLIWMGPAIGSNAFEVGQEVYDAFDGHSKAFQPLSTEGKYLCNLYQIARTKLRKFGISHVFGGDFCTYSDTEHFYSYRRDGITGRMASLIWIEQSELNSQI